MKIILVKGKNSEGCQLIPDLGLMYLATSLRESNFPVRIFDFGIEKISLNIFGSRIIKENHFDMVGIKAHTHELAWIDKLISVIKERTPEAVVTVGGPLPSCDPVGTMERLPLADFAFKGEAEIGFPILIQHLRDDPGGSKKNIPGLIWRNNGQIVCNDPIFIENLDQFGIPSWDLMNPNEYPHETHGIFAKTFPVAPIFITRGCPFECTYCAGEEIFGRKIRRRSVANVIKEIEYLHSFYNIKEFAISDDNFTQNKPYVKELCGALIAKKLGVSWSCPNGVRLDTLDEELLTLMEEAGCHSIGAGIESGSERILRHMKKALTLDLIREKIVLIKSTTQIKVSGFFIIGYPEERKEDVHATIRFACELPIDRALFCIFSPIPGTRIWHYLLKEKIIDQELFDYTSLVDDRSSCPTKYISMGKVKKLQLKAYWRFYRRPRIFLNLFKELHSIEELKSLGCRMFNIISIAS